MKISCVCGGVIFDQSDFLSDKARLIADQDWEDVLYPGGDDQAEQIRELAWNLSRSIWQCKGCGRLYIDDRDGNLHRFDPAESAAPRNLLASTRGDRWKGQLRGHWRPWVTDEPPGLLWWRCGETDSGWEEFTVREELERRYHEEFRRLCGTDTLRSAFLSSAGEMLHQWQHRTARDGTA